MPIIYEARPEMVQWKRLVSMMVVVVVMWWQVVHVVEKVSRLFLIWHVITIRREIFKKSTYYLNFLDAFSMQNRKRSQSGRARDTGKAINQNDQEARREGAPAARRSMRRHSCKQVRVTDMKQWGQGLLILIYFLCQIEL